MSTRNKTGAAVQEYSTGSFRVGQRFLPLEGAYNVRDLGGYTTVFGRRVKWGKVFRSGDLNRLTSNDIEVLSAIPLKTYIDFRSSSEIAFAPDITPPSLQTSLALQVEPGNLLHIEGAKEESGADRMRRLYRQLVSNFQENYAHFFRVLSESTNAPLLFHCSAGKDRTGFAAMLFLAALGVDKETIMHDYLLSGDAVREKYGPKLERKPHLAPYYTVDASYLEAAFDEIDTHFGGMELYLRHNLDVNTTALQELYTEEKAGAKKARVAG